MTTTTYEHGAPPTGAAMDEFHAVDRAALLTRVRAAAPMRRPRRKRRFVIGGIAIGVIAAAGGAAYATLDSPPWVNEAVTGSANENGQHLAVPHMVKIVDLTLADGSRFAAWRGQSADLVCDASADNWDGNQLSGTGGVACGPTGQKPRDLVKLNWAAGKMDVHDPQAVPEPWFPIAYGYVADPAVTQVSLTGELRVTGKDVNITVPVNPATRSYATILPGSVDNKHYPIRELGDSSGVTLRYLDSQGHEIGNAIRLRVMQ